jgi:hypothetical protein
MAELERTYRVSARDSNGGIVDSRKDCSSATAVRLAVAWRVDYGQSTVEPALPRWAARQVVRALKERCL